MAQAIETKTANPRDVPSYPDIWPLLFFAPLLVYWPLVAFPYLLMDDNWLIRGWTEQGYPTLGFVSVVQGRPALAALAGASALLVSTLGEFGVQIFRLCGIAVLGLCCMSTYRILGRFPLSQPFRILGAVIWITLPPAQVIMANGTWLTIGILSALLATQILLHGLTLRSAAAAAILLLISISTYQPLFFISPAIYLLSLYNKDIRVREDFRSLVLHVGFFVGVFVAYYLAWKGLFSYLYPTIQEHRYSPKALLSFRQAWERLPQHFLYRGTRLLDMWDVPNGFPRISGYVQIVLAAVGIAALSRWIFAHSQDWRRGLERSLAILFVGPAAFFVSETAVLPSVNWIVSYTVMMGASLIFSILLTCLLGYTLATSPRWLRSAACTSILALGIVLSSVSVVRHFAIPTWLDAKAIAQYARTHALASRLPDGTLYFCYIDKPQDFGIHEFSWNNVSPFYAYWHTRNVLDLMGEDSRKIVVAIRNFRTKEIYDVSPADDFDQALCRDTNTLDFSRTTKRQLFSDLL